MSRTQIGSSRIGQKSIKTHHIADDFLLPEENIQLNFDTHEHRNKAVLDILRNSIPATLKELDLKDVLMAILEVSDARDTNKTLRETLDNRALKEVTDAILEELNDAKGGYSSLPELFSQMKTEVNDLLVQHKGVIDHATLDLMHAEIMSSRGVYPTLTDRLNSMGQGGGGGGVTDVHMLTPWTYFITLTAGRTLVELPNSYTPANNSLQVFEGPTLLYPGTDGDYIEESPTSIRLNEAFDEDVELKITGVGAGRLYEWIFGFIGNGVDSRIVLLDTYRPGERELQVFEDGVLLSVDDDYIELSPNIIEFVEPSPFGSKILIHKRRY